MHKTIGIYNNKGGAGKTTMAAHLAWYAEYQEIRTIAACIDNQGDLYRILSRGDGVMREGTFHERSPFLSVVYSPKKVPKFQNVELVLVDCPPAIEIAVSFSPSLWLVPIHGRLAFENMHNVLGELESSATDVLILKNNVGRGGKRMDHELRKAIAAIPKAKVCEVEIPEAEAIDRTTDFYKPVWEVPYGSGTRAAVVMETFCRSFLANLGFKMKKRRINAEEE
ncbi:MAG: hypothetical protein JNL82_08430 [Myxococcales bacterium]|nr:hypothetical protein [Myxococcales bacterium]